MFGRTTTVPSCCWSSSFLSAELLRPVDTKVNLTTSNRLEALSTDRAVKEYGIPAETSLKARAGIEPPVFSICMEFANLNTNATRNARRVAENVAG
jgi:hypothetical protein